VFCFICLVFLSLGPCFLVCGPSPPSPTYMAGMTQENLRPCLSHPNFAREENHFLSFKICLVNTPLALVMHFSPLYFWPLGKQTPNEFKKILKKFNDHLKLFMDFSHVFQPFYLIFGLLIYIVRYWPCIKYTCFLQRNALGFEHNFKNTIKISLFN